MTDITPTRSAYLELQQERSGMEEGYHFLDEKRMVLVSEILHELERYKTDLHQFMNTYERAIRSLQGSVGRHGMHGLEVYPPTSDSWDEIQRDSRSVLGVKLETVKMEFRTSSPRRYPVNASPEAEETCRLFAELVSLGATLAGTTGNLIRLRNEYQSTSRRARALEDVLLPEIDQTLARLDTALEDMDKEELVRVHFAMKT